MKCLFLAAGYATRLYPLTENFPKPLLEVKGKTILDWLIADLQATGRVSGFIVVSNHRFAEHFRDWAAARHDVTVLDDGSTSNETRLGAVRDLAFAVEQLELSGEDLLVLAGDNLLDFSLGRFLDYAAAKGTSCVMRYYEPSVERLRKSGVMAVNDDDRILSMAEKPAEPAAHWCCPPFYCYTAADLRLLPEALDGGCGTDAPGSLVAWLSARRPVHAMVMPGRRYDIGSLADYTAIKDAYQGVSNI